MPERERKPVASSSPRRARTAPDFHALAPVRAVLDFANAKLEASEFIVSLIPGGDSRGRTLAGNTVIEHSAAVLLQGCVRRVLERENSPLLAA